jgi:hypothetical protein
MTSPICSNLKIRSRRGKPQAALNTGSTNIWNLIVAVAAALKSEPRSRLSPKPPHLPGHASAPVQAKPELEGWRLLGGHSKLGHRCTATRNKAGSACVSARGFGVPHLPEDCEPLLNDGCQMVRGDVVHLSALNGIPSLYLIGPGSLLASVGQPSLSVTSLTLSGSSGDLHLLWYMPNRGTQHRSARARVEFCRQSQR